MPPTRSLDLSTEQIAYLWRVIGNDIEDANALIQSRSFSQYAQADAARIHTNVRVGASLLGQLPAPASPPTHQEQ